MLKEELINIHIQEPDRGFAEQVKKCWDAVAKPLNGLGVFEDIFVQIGAIQKSADVDIKKRVIIAMCADNGIVEEGVSQSGQDVTSTVTRFMGLGLSSVGKMGRAANTDIFPVDIGINNDEKFQGVLDCKVRKGTRNFLKEPAMTENEALCAIETGMDIVKQLKAEGYRLIGTGEMGIGNTTTSSALVVALTGEAPERVVGRGAGLNDDGLKKKRQVVTTAMSKYSLRGDDAFKALCCVGGLDIAGLVGVFIGGALHQVPIVIDGVISATAALVAERIVKGCKNYMIPSHGGKEPAIEVIYKELGFSPIINGQMALGEGTGVTMLFALLDVAAALYESKTTFEEMEIEQYERYV